ncbi:Adenine DNA glycosylase [Nibea albiflora]|uniref:Adenine DNA glycosylase n=1 Tax=Nibea albiflora TaxID=240163 RepID=A0ACB7EPR5_NIBAL|nr:Adenine DNA glycosylase [Nibea albiflora]
MPAQEEAANIGKVLSFLREWDRGDSTVRSRMLNTFLAQNTGKTFYELELEFAQVASLFLARLTTWMRLTDQYLMEFLGDGGVLTLLEILNHSQCKEEEKAEALRLLLTVANAGRKYKEIICESHGVKVIAECLVMSNTDETQETSWAVLESLTHGNPKYQNQIYKSLIALMMCSSPKAQQLVLHTLRTVQSKMKTAHHSIIEPLLNMLRSLHVVVQDEAINLILDLKCYDVRPVLLKGLVALLRPAKEEVQQHQNMDACWPRTAKRICRELVTLGVIQHLLHAMGNREHNDAQIQASLALEHFVHSYPVIEEQVQRVIGSTLFAAFMHNADTLYMNIDETQAEILLTNKLNITEGETTNASSPSTYHTFHDAADVALLRSRLLSWYDKEQRELPWRTLRWPTVQDLAAATLEEVNQMWAGLGYYSRGKRLHEGAQKVVSELNGQMPRTVDSLLKQLPGVGRYTAAAIGSIALGQVTGAVDGNLIRVLCRMRAIGADSTSPAVTEALWSLANVLVDPERPGDFNQAMMELGARVCTPKSPLCSQCPVQSHCHSYRKVHVKQEENSRKLLGKLDRKPLSLPDIEDCMNSGTCPLCPSEPWDDELGVQNFPRKPAKKPPRVERTLTCVVIRPGEEGEDEYLLTQRPNKGLLAGLWEFPSLLQEEKTSDVKQKQALCSEISRLLGTRLTDSLLQYVGEVVHVFSHIHQTYVVHSVRLKDGDTQTQTESAQWLDRSALQEAAVSAGVKKIVKLCDSVVGQKQQTSKDGKRQKHVGTKMGKKPQSSKKARLSAADSRQLSLSSYFKTVKEES